MAEQRIPIGSSAPSIRGFFLRDDVPDAVDSSEPGISLSYRRSLAGVPLTSGTVMISLADLGSVNAAYSSGGMIVTDATSGEHRLDLPSVVVAAGADAVDLFFSATDTDLVFIPAGRIVLGDVPADVQAVKGTGVTDIDDFKVDAAGIRTAVGLAAANLDTQLSSIGTDVDSAALAASNAAANSFSADTKLGTSGDGLTAIPWNPAWDAEVQSEVNDALVALKLDRLFFTVVVGADVTDNSFAAKLVSKSTPADFDSFNNTTDSNEGIADAVGAIDGGGGGGSYEIDSFSQAALDQLAGHVAIYPQSLVNSITQEITLRRGDSYYQDNGLALEFTFVTGETLWPTDLTDHAVTFAYKTDNGRVTVTGAIDQPTGSSRKVHIDVPGTKISESGDFSWELILTNTSNGRTYTPRSGRLFIKDDIY